MLPWRGGGRQDRAWQSGNPSSGGCGGGAIAVVLLVLAIVGVAVWLFAFGGVDYFAGSAATAPPPTTVVVPAAATSPTATATPTRTLPPKPTNTALPTATVTPSPTDTPSPTASPAVSPTVAPTAPLVLPTERQIVVNAFSECNGQYAGRDRRFRESAADSAIEDGRSTVEDIRQLVEQYCDGVFPDVPATAGQAGSAQPTATARPTPTATPTGAPASTRPPEPASASDRNGLPAIDCGPDCAWDYRPLVGGVDWVQKPQISQRGVLSLAARIKDGYSLTVPGRNGGSSNISLTDGGSTLYGSILPPAGPGWKWTPAPGQWIASIYEYRNRTLSVTARIAPEAVNHEGLTLCLWTGGVAQRGEILGCTTVERP